jgi:hypothetical protein
MSVRQSAADAEAIDERANDPGSVLGAIPRYLAMARAMGPLTQAPMPLGPVTGCRP